MILSSSWFRTCILVGATLISSGAAAQRAGGGSNSPARTTTPRTPTTPDVATMPVFVSGKVLLEGGGVLPEPVAIERICNGVTRREGYTDFKGQFEFQLGVNMSFQDASENDARITPNSSQRSGLSAGRRSTDLNGCEFRAVLAGHQSSVALLRTAGETWRFNIGTIILKRMGDANGATVSVTSMAAPKDAIRAYEKAQKAKQDKPNEAQKQLNKAIQIYPQFAAAWSLLGDIHRQQKQFDQARNAYTRAVEADPQFVNPAFGLALIAMLEKKWDEAILLSDQVLKLNAAAFPLAYFFHAAANYNQENFDAAEESAKKFKALDTKHSHPDVCLLLSRIFSRKQDYAGAAREIHDYLAMAPNSPDAEALKIEARRFEELSVSARRE
jgi:hypothetical protein